MAATTGREGVETEEKRRGFLWVTPRVITRQGNERIARRRLAR